jgi:hypothetical protein
VIIDGAGVVQQVFVGYGDESDKQLDAGIDAVLSGR